MTCIDRFENQWIKCYIFAVEMFFSYTKSDFDCEYIALNPLIFKSVYTRHNVSSDVIVGAFGGVDFGVKRGRVEL